MKTQDYNLPDTALQEKADLFWKWFSENHDTFLLFDDTPIEKSSKSIEQLSVELDNYNPELFFEIGKKPNDDKIQLVITAAGNKDHFPDVELLCSRAPTFENWDIIAFKPPMGINFKLQYRGMELNPDKIIFIPLDNKHAPEAVGLHVCFDDLSDKNREILVGGTYLILDSILGERTTTLDIDYLNIIKTPIDIESYDFKYLSEIAEFIKEKKELKK